MPQSTGLSPSVPPCLDCCPPPHLPLLLLQYISSAIISPPYDPDDPNSRNTKILTALLPLMLGWFSLNVPSGLSLYYLSNTILSTTQQVYLRKFGGASIKVNKLGPVTKPGSGRRTGGGGGGRGKGGAGGGGGHMHVL